jgi:hypothetical protein
MTAAIFALPVTEVNPNFAIVTTVTNQGYYDVYLNITHLDLLPGLDNWDDLAFTSLQTPWFSSHDGTMDIRTWEKLAVLDIASGRICEATEGCMQDIDSAYQRLYDAEERLVRDGPQWIEA